MADTPRPRTKILRRDPPEIVHPEVQALLDGRRLLSTAETAEMLGMTSDGLRMLRNRGKGPKFVQVSDAVIRYALPDIDE